MYDTPGSLQDSCIDFICDNISALCESQTNLDDQMCRLAFGGSEIYLHNEISEQLLAALCERGQLDDLTLTLFDAKVTRLRSVKLKNASQLTTKGLKVLRSHHIAHLEATGLSRVTVGDLIACLGEWTLHNLRSLNVANSTFVNSTAKYCVVVSLSKLRNLHTLNVSNTEFNRHGLEIVSEDLGFLENLDISNTRVSDISPLRKCRDRLKSLSMYNLTSSSYEEVISVIFDLRELRHLDISDDKIEHPFEMLAPSVKFRVSELLQHPSCLPHLTSLDISGKDDIDATDLRENRIQSAKISNIGVPSFPLRFVDISDLDLNPKDCTERLDNPVIPSIPSLARNLAMCPVEGVNLVQDSWENIVSNDWKFLKHHSCLRFLGLVHTDACYDDMFTDALNACYKPNLVVTGSATEAQILEALRRYPNRSLYVQKSLYYLFRLTQNCTEPRVDIIELIVPGMRAHPKQLGIQMAATACLYTLSRGEVGQKIHPRWLHQIVELTLIAMESFPSHAQLQKNTLLTLCSDRILQEVTFDKYRCAKLVMDCLCTFEDTSMNRMCVAICSILAAKISTQETSKLGASSTYMKKLLDIVRSKMDESLVDITMKFTLSALWNLTDESPQTCSVFLNLRGLDLFLQVLKKFNNESAVETKVLGLVNNIAEVKELRPALMMESFIVSLRSLLQSSHIDVSYFAAGIIAHLASDGELSWTVTSVLRSAVLKELGEVVLSWEAPEGEMVAYRSFSPFFPLLTCCEASEVQLWAIWAVHHVCTKNTKRYCPMLLEAGGLDMLHQLLHNPGTNSHVIEVCNKIICVMASEGLYRQW